MSIQTPLLLASSSPRRQQLLADYGYSFSVCEHGFDETRCCLNQYPSIRRFIRDLAFKKAHSAAALHDPCHWILSADTIVVLGHTVLGKPDSVMDATRMLTSLSGIPHQVYTAFCLYHQASMYHVCRCTQANVTLRALSQTEIAHYIGVYHPFDKAGSYGFQDCPDFLISTYSGDKHTIIGLSMQHLKQTIRYIQKSTGQLY